MTEQQQQKNLTKNERIQAMKTCLNNGDLVCTGDQIVMLKTVNTPEGQQQEVQIPVGVFLRKNDDPDKVWFATTTGVLLFECNDFHKFAQDKAKETFLKNLDLMLRQKTAIINMKSKKENKSENTG